MSLFLNKIKKKKKIDILVVVKKNKVK